LEIQINTIKSKEITFKNHLKLDDQNFDESKLEESSEYDTFKTLKELEKELKDVTHEKTNLEKKIQKDEQKLESLVKKLYEELGKEYEDLKQKVNEDLIIKQFKTEKEKKDYFKK